MFRLVALGGLALIDANGAVAAEQRRRLALLALLAGGGRLGITREKLVGYLWPEHTSDRSRHALEQLLYHLRRQLRLDAVVGRDPLRLDPGVITADVIEFETAVEAGDDARAVELYRGPFLDGFYLNGLPSFEAWTEQERARLAGSYTRALERLAARERSYGHHTAEIECWRLLSQADPIATRPAVGLMRALAAAGDFVAALRHARLYAERVWRELQAAPDPVVLECAAEVRHRAEAGTPAGDPPVRRPDEPA